MNNPYEFLAYLPTWLLVSYYLIELAFLVLILTSYWKIFVKAGEAGWKALIPIYDMYVLVRIIGKPKYWFYTILGLTLIFLASMVFGLYGMKQAMEGNQQFMVENQKAMGIIGIALLLSMLVLLVLLILVYNGLARSFSTSLGFTITFTIGLILLPIIFYPLLAFGDYKYIDPRKNLNDNDSSEIIEESQQNLEI